MGSISTPTDHAFKHERLGQLVGRTRTDDIVQFRGIPFASIPGRFRQSVLTTELPQQPFIAKNPGSTCPHPDQAYWEYWKASLPASYPVLTEPTTDELNCLNLSLTIPRSALSTSQKKIPVFIFIHGGAFVGGSHAIQLSGREVFDGFSLVQHSISLGKPIIAIGINYRVGPLGFLSSTQLIDFNRSHSEDICNYGLHDQRRALDWVSEFISGFGGDPGNVTIQGTSAGAASCNYLAMFPGRKFQRAILASGTLEGIGPMPVEAQQPLFDRMVQANNPGTSDDNALEVLLQADVRQITHCTPIHVLHPLIDNQYIFQGGLDAYKPDEPLPDLLVGAAEFEAELATGLLTDFGTNLHKSNTELLEASHEVFSSNAMLASPSTFPFDCPEVQKIYGVEGEPSTAVEQLADLMGDVLFLVPTVHTALHTARRAKSKAWLYYFEATNPFPASHSPNRAHHGVNDLYVFNIAPDQIPQKNRAEWDGGVRTTQKSWIDFTNGEAPWVELRSGDEGRAAGPVFVFRGGDSSKCHETLEDAIGVGLADKWAALLRASK